MKILLVSPSNYELYGGLNAPEHPPMGLAYIGAVLEKEGHQVRIIDIDADRINNKELENIIRFSNFDMIGVTTLTPTFNKAISIANIVKKNSDAYTVLGGIHPTIMPQESVRPASVDFVIRGEGEETIVQLARYIEERKNLNEIDGLVYKADGKVVMNKNRMLIRDLDTLPFPARHLFDNRNYAYPDALFFPVLPVITSRGCPGNCTFCNINNIFSRRFRARSADNVVDEFEQLAANIGAKEIHIWDDNFITSKQRIFEIKDEIKKRKLNLKFSFPNGLRIDFLNEDILKALKDMGTYSIALGVESGNQRILDKINKGISVGEIKEKFILARQLGFEIWAFFMIGLPSETKETILETINFAIDLNPDIAKFHLLKPFPGTKIYEEFLKEGLISNTNFDNYGFHTKPVHRLPTLSEDDLLEWQKRAYRMFYLRPGKILSHVLRLKSWNRFRLNTKTSIRLLRKMLTKR